MSLWHQITGPLYPLVDWPFSTGRDGGYNFFSGIGLGIFWPLVYWRRHVCHIRRCARLAWHPHPDHGHPVCRRHHPHDAPTDSKSSKPGADSRPT